MKNRKLDSNNTCIWCGCHTKIIRTVKLDGELVIVNICTKHANIPEKDIVEMIGSL